MKLSKTLKVLFLILFLPFLFLSCKGPDGKFKLPGGDARKTPADPKKRIEQNLREGKGFRINEGFGKKNRGVFEFASSNELWRASLDVVDFMPLSSVNYSGGIIITDWYSDSENPNESVKVSIRFLTNELRSDALDIKIFKRQCSGTLINCNISELSGNLSTEMKKEILKKAAVYKTNRQEESVDNNYKYPVVTDSKF